MNSEPVIVNDRRGTQVAMVPGDIAPIPDKPLPLNPPPVSQVFAPNRRQVLAAFATGKKVIINGVVFQIRKVTDKDLVLRPVWLMPVQEPATL